MERPDGATIAAGAVRGAVAAMAMTGMRAFTRELGIVHRVPPDEIREEGVPGVFSRVPAEYHHAATELAHWTYGAAFGGVFGAMPRAVRRHAWTGPLYGLAIWISFEAAVVPLLGLRRPAERRTRERVAVLADHVLYGVIVARRAAKL